MPAIWMLFMFFVLGFWAMWLNDPDELLHPRSKQRARFSLIIVGAIGLVSLIVCVSIQVAA